MTLWQYIMHDKLAIYTGDESLDRLLTILRRLGDFSLEVKYKKQNANTQADALSSPNTMNENIPHYDRVEIR